MLSLHSPYAYYFSRPLWRQLLAHDSSGTSEIDVHKQAAVDHNSSVAGLSTHVDAKQEYVSRLRFFCRN